MLTIYSEDKPNIEEIQDIRDENEINNNPIEEIKEIKETEDNNDNNIEGDIKLQLKINKKAEEIKNLENEISSIKQLKED